jgi:hypothetical protein
VLIKISGALLILSQPICAELTSSAQTLSHGGGRSTSLNYANDSNLSDLAGISEINALRTKQGFLGQIDELVGVELVIPQPSVGEGESIQVSAIAQLDDATHYALLASEIAWSWASGPVLSISENGLATTAMVFRDVPAVIAGRHAGLIGFASFQVVNRSEDDFGSYAQDGLNDAWQVDNFGIGNPQAAPMLDPDGDGFTNQFEFLAGLIPTDHSSSFQLTIRREDMPMGQMVITLSPRFQDRVYTLVSCQDLVAGKWAPVGGAVFDSGETRTIIDAASSEPRKFYRVEITKP